jgi:hypothetical protein
MPNSLFTHAKTALNVMESRNRQVRLLLGAHTVLRVSNLCVVLRWPHTTNRLDIEIMEPNSDESSIQRQVR